MIGLGSSHMKAALSWLCQMPRRTKLHGPVLGELKHMPWEDSLNSRILSDKELSARHCRVPTSQLSLLPLQTASLSGGFAPTCSINLIESVLRQDSCSKEWVSLDKLDSIQST